MIKKHFTFSVNPEVVIIWDILEIWIMHDLCKGRGAAGEEEVSGDIETSRYLQGSLAKEVDD